MKYISGFDTLRALSITLVILGHLGMYHWLPENDFVRMRVWQLISGTTGVQIFFTISGFLITTILINEKQKKSRINFKNFFARRFLRLLPPLIVFYIAIGILMAIHWIDSTGVGLLFSMSYIYNFVPKYYYTSELGHTWSLAVEEQFYFTWPFLLHYVKSKLALKFTISALLVLCGLALYYLSIFNVTTYFAERFFIPAVAPILIGATAALFKIEYATTWAKLFKRNMWIFFIGLVIFIFPLYTPSLLLFLTSMIQAIGVAIILIWLTYNQEGKFMPYWDNVIFRYIGKISYGLYVYQGLFLTTGPTDKLAIQQYPLNIFLTICIAILSYELIEKRALKMKSRFS